MFSVLYDDDVFFYICFSYIYNFVFNYYINDIERIY